MLNITSFTSRNRRPGCSRWETDIPRDTRSYALFFRAINLLTFIYICPLNFCTPLSCNYLLEIQRSSYQCDSLLQRCSLKKLFLNISQYYQVFLINFQVFRSIQVFSCEYWKNFKSDYSEEHLRTVASEAWKIRNKTRESRCPVSILKYLLKLTVKHLYQGLFFNEITRYRSATQWKENDCN